MPWRSLARLEGDMYASLGSREEEEGVAAVSASRRLLVAEQEAGLQGATQVHATSESCTSSSHPIEASADLSLARLLARTTAPPRATTAAEASGSPSFTMSLPRAAAVAEAGPSMTTTTLLMTTTPSRRMNGTTTTSARLAAVVGLLTSTTERGWSYCVQEEKEVTSSQKRRALRKILSPEQLCHHQGRLPSPTPPAQILPSISSVAASTTPSLSHGIKPHARTA